MEPGHFYFISDDFFKKFPQEEFLMKNKQERHARPCFFCFSDSENANLFWCVPLSSHVQKYNMIINNKLKHLQERGIHYPKCSTIRFAKVLGHSSAFLIQNMFPVTAKYITEQYLDSKTHEPVTISQASTNDICINAKKILQLVTNGHHQLVYVDIMQMRQTLLTELEQEQSLGQPITDHSQQVSALPLQDRVYSAQLEATARNASQLMPEIPMIQEAKEH